MAVIAIIESDRFPYLPVRLSVGGVELAVEALLDTGLDGDVVLPTDAIPEGVTPGGTFTWYLGYGSRVDAPWYVGSIRVGTADPFDVTITTLGPEYIVGRGVARRFTIILDHGEHVFVQPRPGCSNREEPLPMREPPNLPNETITAAVEGSYGASIDRLTFLPIGHDSSAWVYRADASDGVAYFLKVRTGAVHEPGLVVPRSLRDRGVGHIVAPLPTTAGALWAILDGYALILYPFIAGRTGMDIGLTEDQWVAFGAAVKRIHATPLVPELVRLVGSAPFAPRWGGATRDWGVARNLADRVVAGSFADPVEHELAAFWRTRAAEIRALVDRAEYLGKRLQRMSAPVVLCHADLHTGNVLLDADGQLWIVDWDETALAPKERDLMFVVGGISRELVGPREEELFFQGYGQTAIDPLALAYYRHAWAVQDIADYGEQVFSRPDLGPASKRAAVEIFKSLFAPGEIVDLAREADQFGA